MDPRSWTAETLTARQVVARADATLLVVCEGCRTMFGADPWRIGARLADEPLRRLRFRCRRCGVYAAAIKVGLRDSARGVDLFTITLAPACWDDGHRADQERALIQAEIRREARRQQYRDRVGGDA